MAKSAVLKVDIVADGKKARGELDQTSGRFEKFGKGVAIAAAAAAALVVGAVAVGKKLVDAGERAATSNARIGQIAESMGLFGDRTQAVTDRLVDYANKVALATGIDQNQIKATQAKLLTFKELAATADDVGGNFDRATKASIDLAAAGFGTAESNAAQLGKALQDPIKGLTALTRSGVTFTDAEKDRIRTLVESNQMGEAQAMVLAAIEQQVGGTAEATANATDRMSVAWSQVQERLGEKLLPLVDKLADWFINKALPAGEALAEQLETHLGPVIEDVGRFISEKLIPAARQVFEWFQTKIAPALRSNVTPTLSQVGSVFGIVGRIIRDQLIPFAKQTFTWFQEKIAPAIRSYVQPALEGMRSAVAQVTDKLREHEPQIRTVVGWLLTFYQDCLQPIVAFIVSKVAPVVGQLMGGAFQALGVILGGIITLFARIVDRIAEAVRWMRTLGDTIRNSPLGQLGSAIGGLFSRGSVTVGAGGGMWSTAAAGGGWGPALSVLGGGGRGGVTVVERTVRVDVNFNGLVTDPHGVAMQVRDLLGRYDVRTGRA